MIGYVLLAFMTGLWIGKNFLEPCAPWGYRKRNDIEDQS